MNHNKTPWVDVDECEERLHFLKKHSSWRRAVRVKEEILLFSMHSDFTANTKNWQTN